MKISSKASSDKANDPTSVSSIPKKSTLSEIQRLQRDRDERRKQQQQIKIDRAAEELKNKENGTPGDVDFQRMIRSYREQAAPEQPHIQSNDKICICVRKRPISSKEVKKMDHDSVTCANPIVAIHDCKMKVDGISKYLDNNLFEMDHTFHEENTTEDIYYSAVEPLVEFVLDNGRATVFAYGQTGSGKTYTMQGIQGLITDDLFALIEARKLAIQVSVSFFEIYGGRCQDLLNERQRLNVREDGAGDVVVSDLMETATDSAEALRSVIEDGNRNRTTHATESNDESSRSHAICQISLRTNGKELGRLSLIDLAGSERGADTKSHNRQRRMEGAEINKSLLALKECIRALDSNSSHIPYRASKLTLVLKDSFTRQKSRTVMIATVSPAASSADHTINTLRYADRIKERTVSQHQGAASPAPVSSRAPAAPATSARKSPAPTPPVSSRQAGTGVNTGGANTPSTHITSSRNSPLPGKASSKPATTNDPKQNGRAVGPPVGVKVEAPSTGIQRSRSDEEDHSTARSNVSSARSGQSQTRSNGIVTSENTKKSSYNQIGRVEHKMEDEKENHRDNRTRDHRKDNIEDDDHDDEVESLDEGYGKEDRGDDVLEYSMEEEFQKTVQSLFEEEEELLNLHMATIQENAELLTEEGRLLQQMQTDNYDIDAYAYKLDQILARKQELIVTLREKLGGFRKQLVMEETISRRVRGMC